MYHFVAVSLVQTVREWEQKKFYVIEVFVYYVYLRTKMQKVTELNIVMNTQTSHCIYATLIYFFV